MTLGYVIDEEKKKKKEPAEVVHASGWDASKWSFSSHTQLQGDPVVDTEPAGEIAYLTP